MSSDGTEVELKFEVSPDDLQKLAVSRSLRGADGQLVEHKDLVSTYFDTPKHMLRRRGVSLRVRQAGKKRVQTIKTASDGALSRGEWEHELEGDQPDLRAARGTALEPLLSKHLQRKLDPVFATHVHRTLVPLRPGNSRVELALDQGQVRAGQNSTPLAEVELELKSGSVADLFKAARQVTDLVPARLTLKSKSEQGYDLIADQPLGAVRASKIMLDRKASVGSAFQEIGRSVLRHITANEPAVLEGQPEGVHQMRVGVRRLRAAIWVFSKLLRCKQTEAIKHDLKWLAGKLGSVRDLDVFLNTKVRRLMNAEPTIAGLHELVGELDYRRALAAEAAKTAVAGSRYRLLMFNALEWIEDGAWLKRRSAAADQPLKPFVAELFARRIRKTTKRTKKIGDLNIHDRHKVRIAIKKLRYTVYFFDSVFAGSKNIKALSRYRDCLESLQDNLGALNDIAVHQKLVTNLETTRQEKKSRMIAFAAGVVVGSERRDVKPLLATAEKAARKLRRAKKFWI